MSNFMFSALLPQHIYAVIFLIILTFSLSSEYPNSSCTMLMVSEHSGFVHRATFISGICTWWYFSLLINTSPFQVEELLLTSQQHSDGTSSSFSMCLGMSLCLLYFYQTALPGRVFVINRTLASLIWNFKTWIKHERNTLSIR